jgi:hypothetical protein
MTTFDTSTSIPLPEMKIDRKVISAQEVKEARIWSEIMSKSVPPPEAIVLCPPAHLDHSPPKSDRKILTKAQRKQLNEERRLRLHSHNKEEQEEEKDDSQGSSSWSSHSNDAMNGNTNFAGEYGLKLAKDAVLCPPAHPSPPSRRSPLDSSTRKKALEDRRCTTGKDHDAKTSIPLTATSGHNSMDMLCYKSTLHVTDKVRLWNSMSAFDDDGWK